MSMFKSRPRRHGKAWWPWPLLGGLALALSAQAQNGVYRCTDAQGRTAYQAQPCPDSQASKRLVQEPPSGRMQPADAGAALDAAQDGGKPPGGRPAPPALSAKPGQSYTVTPGITPAEAATWGKEADVIVVSGYEFETRRAKVQVQHPARPVLLVLTSYNAVQWEVLPAPGTRILAVLYASIHRPPSTVKVPPGVPVLEDDLPYASGTGNINFRKLLRQLHEHYGVDRLTGFRGSRRLPELLSVGGTLASDPALTLEGIRPEPARVSMNFDLLGFDGRRVAWTNSGPKGGKLPPGVMRGSSGTDSVVLSEDGKEAYALTGNGGELRWYPQGLAGAFLRLEPPPELPRLSWGTGLALDSRRGILALVSMGGEGFFYRYDTRRKQWLDAHSLQERDLMSLSVLPATGGYVSLSTRLELVSFTERGELEAVRPLGRLLPDVFSTYDPDNRTPEGITVVAQDQAVALVNISDGNVTHIWTYERASGKAQLTYKMPVETPRAPAPAPAGERPRSNRNTSTMAP